MPLDAHLERPEENPYTLLGRARLHRVGFWRFPVHRLVSGDDTVALMGRGGWTTVYLGRGQRVDLPDGATWTLRSIGVGGTFIPIVVDELGRAVATAGASHGTYGINLKDHACVLMPADGKSGLGRPDHWILWRHEDELARITRHPATVDAIRPTHLGAVLLSFELIRHGLAEESMPRIPAFSWNR